MFGKRRVKQEFLAIVQHCLHNQDQASVFT